MTCSRYRKGAIVGFARFVCVLPLTCLLCVAAPKAELPGVTSVFPLGGHQGSTFTAEVRGQNLDKAYAVWFDSDDLKAEVKGVERIEPEAKDAEPKKDPEEKKKQQQQRL